MTQVLYDIFEKAWKKTNSSSIWLYSDPHFGDADLWGIRQITPEEQVKRINSKVGKHDTIIFLGDIGDVEYIKKIRGYKVLILGNHDKGATNYKKVISYKTVIDPKFKSDIIDTIQKSSPNKSVEALSNILIKSDLGIQEIMKEVIEDNQLFDEVYDGELAISDKIRLTHIPDISPYRLNIHGHCHPFSKLDFAGLSYNEIIKRHLDRTIEKGIPELNLCCEYLDFYPINLNAIVKSGIFKLVKDPTRELIDNKKND